MDSYGAALVFHCSHQHSIPHTDADLPYAFLKRQTPQLSEQAAIHVSVAKNILRVTASPSTTRVTDCTTRRVLYTYTHPPSPPSPLCIMMDSRYIFLCSSEQRCPLPCLISSAERPGSPTPPPVAAATATPMPATSCRVGARLRPWQRP